MSVKNYNFLIIAFVFVLNGCGTKNQTEYVNIYELNNKLEQLENRMNKTEKKLDNFSVLALSLDKKINSESENLNKDSTMALTAIYSLEKLNPVKGKELEKYLFINNLKNKTMEFEKQYFELANSTIIFNKKGNQIGILKEGTIIESTYRISKYFLLDRYIIDNKSFVPSIDVFVSEENFKK